MNTITATLAATVAALLLSAPPTSAQAKEADPITSCVTLSPQHQGTRVSGNQQMLLKDGDAHYRVGFRSHCDAIARSSAIRIETAGQDNQLCPEGSSVRARNASCAVHSVETIDAEEYTRQARRNRR
ncbi:hypothetical protein [Luteimonas kalidii]|uniref:Secreted protein n=1 Tax=Luteimonas kalidii TaxID=3042025 RepID=A0ABT6JUZ4_9GAMM|nr:hypothetical protein [Luteimonas kalidii]MDH5834300.1 hypothetical protein [Luteimonas kalidii]